MLNIIFTILIVYYVLAFSLLIASGYIKAFKRYGLLAKTATSLGFIGIFIVSSFISDSISLFLNLLPGFILCFIGDVFLELNDKHKDDKLFLFGLSSFLLGHIGFIWGFNTVRHFSLPELIIPVAAVILAWLLTKLPAMKVGKMKISVCAYAFFVAWLFSKGLFVFFFSNVSFSAFSIMLLLGSALFFISDLIILFLYFYEKKYKPMRFFNLLTYYLGLLLLASSMLFA